MNFKNVLKAMRPFSFTVSFVPPVLALAIAYYKNPGFSAKWFLFALTFLGGFLAHAASNILSDYFDFEKGVDRPGTYGSSGVLIENIMYKNEVLSLAMMLFFLAGLFALAIMYMVPSGFSLLWLILAGGFLGFFYTTPPFNLKYVALGDFAVFMAFGPLMTLGGYFVQTGVYAWEPFVYALPLGLIVDGILHANNTRDIENDKKYSIKTLAIILGLNGARKMYSFLIYGAYFSIVCFVALKLITPYALLVFITLPMAVSNIKKLNAKDSDLIVSMDAVTAKFHSVFSLVFIASIIIGWKY